MIFGKASSRAGLLLILVFKGLSARIQYDFSASSEVAKEESFESSPAGIVMVPEAPRSSSVKGEKDVVELQTFITDVDICVKQIREKLEKDQTFNSGLFELGCLFKFCEKAELDDSIKKIARSTKKRAKDLFKYAQKRIVSAEKESLVARFKPKLAEMAKLKFSASRDNYDILAERELEAFLGDAFADGPLDELTLQANISQLSQLKSEVLENLRLLRLMKKVNAVFSENTSRSGFGEEKSKISIKKLRPRVRRIGSKDFLTRSVGQGDASKLSKPLGSKKTKKKLDLPNSSLKSSGRQSAQKASISPRVSGLEGAAEFVNDRKAAIKKSTGKVVSEKVSKPMEPAAAALESAYVAPKDSPNFDKASSVAKINLLLDRVLQGKHGKPASKKKGQRNQRSAKELVCREDCEQVAELAVE